MKADYTVLVIEDSEVDMALVESILQRARNGFTLSLIFAKSLAEGLLKVPLSDAIVCDLELPDSSGADTAEKVADVADGRPLIVLTAATELKLFTEVGRRSKAIVIAKPAGDGLIPVVASMLGAAAAWHEREAEFCDKLVALCD